MTTTLNLLTPVVGAATDPELVARTYSGDTQAFGQIVERYQSLICSLTFSACGDVHVSEDLAQETFVSAWRQLPQLREPGKLRSWLCGIARNVIHNFLRRQKRNPTAAAQSLDDDGMEEPADSLSPADEAMQRQEALLLWRALQRLPEQFREPMVLYYRQQESVSMVAAALELSEDAVKQRLARGRELLASNLERTLGRTLKDSGPGKVFTLGVLAALPALGATSCAAGAGVTAVKGGAAAAKAAGWMGWCSVLFGPVLVVLGMWFGYRMSIDGARSGEERGYIQRNYRRMVVCIVVFSLALGALIFFGHDLGKSLPDALAVMIVGLVFAYAVAIGTLVLSGIVGRKKLREMEARGLVTPLSAASNRATACEYRSRWSFLGLPLIHMCLGRRPGERVTPVKAWIAIGDVAVGGLFAFGGVAVAPICMGGCALGLAPLGGCVVGLFPWGGFSVGLWAIGGMALGYLAFGGVAIGWRAAAGGLAVAHDYALGGLATAQHVGDAAAQAFIRGERFFQIASVLIEHAFWLNLLWVLPMLQMWRKMKRAVSK